MLVGASLSAPLMPQDDGFIAKILVAEGHKDISVGTPLLVLVEDEESVGAFSDYKPSDAAAPAPAASADQAAKEPHNSDSSQAGELLNAPASIGLIDGHLEDARPARYVVDFMACEMSVVGS